MQKDIRYDQLRPTARRPTVEKVRDIAVLLAVIYYHLYSELQGTFEDT